LVVDHISFEFLNKICSVSQYHNSPSNDARGRFFLILTYTQCSADLQALQLGDLRSWCRGHGFD